MSYGLPYLSNILFISIKIIWPSAYILYSLRSMASLWGLQLGTTQTMK